jgi:hypothetical protein
MNIDNYNSKRIKDFIFIMKIDINKIVIMNVDDPLLVIKGNELSLYIVIFHCQQVKVMSALIIIIPK